MRVWNISDFIFVFFFELSPRDGINYNNGTAREGTKVKILGLLLLRGIIFVQNR